MDLPEYDYSITDSIKLCDIVTVKEAARILSVSLQTVYLMIRNGRLTVLPVNNAKLLNRQEVLSYRIGREEKIKDSGEERENEPIPAVNGESELVKEEGVGVEESV